MHAIIVWLFPEIGHYVHPDYWYKAYILYAQYSGVFEAALQSYVQVLYSIVFDGWFSYSVSSQRYSYVTLIKIKFRNKYVFIYLHAQLGMEMQFIIKNLQFGNL